VTSLTPLGGGNGEAEKFRLLVQGTTQFAMFLVDPDGRVASWNEGARRILGYEAAEILGQPADIILHPRGPGGRRARTGTRHRRARRPRPGRALASTQGRLALLRRRRAGAAFGRGGRVPGLRQSPARRDRAGRERAAASGSWPTWRSAPEP
jgi:PAS domain S-box-containing protein